MNCQETRKWISPYLDSELDPTKTFEVSQHLESCEQCRDRFEKEGRADELMAAMLRREEPFVNWAALERAISTPRRRIAVLRPRWVLAAAACVAFLLISLGEWPDRTIAGDPARWAVDELHQLSPNCEPFADGPGCKPADIIALASEVLDCKLGFSFADGQVAGHPITLAQANRRTSEGGVDRVQVRLNCCGFPVLLVIAARSEKGVLAGLSDALDEGGGKYEGEVEAHNFKYHCHALRKGDYIVLAVSPHKVRHLVADIQIPSR